MIGMPKYSVGIIGCGGIAPSHIRGWLNTGSAEVTAVADINPAKAKALAEKFGVKKSYSDYVEMLREKSLDFVSICTWAQTTLE